MSELPIDPSLCRRSVAVAGKPEWGAGRVLKVLSTTVAGAAQHRVTIQFTHGTRTLVSPPARLIEPQVETERKPAGWIDSLAGATIDERLKRVPDDVLRVLGGIQSRLAAVYPLYDFRDDPHSLSKWARGQTGVADPLSHWTRDELTLAFAEFCRERDAHLRGLLAVLKQTEGPVAVQEAIAAVDEDRREAVLAAVARPI